jgi:hypothetical protein
MKVKQEVPKKKFVPVTITLESKKEVEYLRNTLSESLDVIELAGGPYNFVEDLFEELRNVE